MIRRACCSRGAGRAGSLPCLVAAFLCPAFAGVDAMAQDLTPRTYWPAPNGTRLFIFGYSNQAGDVIKFYIERVV